MNRYILLLIPLIASLLVCLFSSLQYGFFLSFGDFSWGEILADYLGDMSQVFQEDTHSGNMCPY